MATGKRSRPSESEGEDADRAREPSDGERERALAIKFSDGSERIVGTFATRLHTDIRTIILSIRRGLRKKGRPIALSAERTAAVDAALRAGSTFESIDGLRIALERWTQEALDPSANGINQYYSAERTVHYSQHNARAQQTLSTRVWELQAARADSPADLVLDLGCGSGLSSRAFEELGAQRVIGCDLSLAMLAHARAERAALDVVQVDVSKALPFREATFASALSVSTVQHLLNPADGVSGEARLQTMFREMARVLRPARALPACFSVQFHVNDAADALRVRDAARGVGVGCELVVDQPHQSDSRRWFLAAVPAAAHASAAQQGRRPRPCALYWDLSDGCATCPLELHATLGAASLLGAEHAAWCTQEHLREAHRWVRVLRRARRVDARAAGNAEPTTRRGEVSSLHAAHASVADALMSAHGVDIDLSTLKLHAAAVLELMHNGRAAGQL